MPLISLAALWVRVDLFLVFLLEVGTRKIRFFNVTAHLFVSLEVAVRQHDRHDPWPAPVEERLETQSLLQARAHRPQSCPAAAVARLAAHT